MDDFDRISETNNTLLLCTYPTLDLGRLYSETGAGLLFHRKL